MKYLTVCVALLSLFVSDTLAISCGAQANSQGVRCKALDEPCPKGFRPVYYDDPAPCYRNQRCCI
ncbi:hypothetical protein BJX63DRAFT_437888 [Aspergillus granulosus]|uniref:Uncharacterized protein n=1 Tax=Aspergillus granulosus TaxID=176169 RepID=A0ABR4GV47_9EURO